jgi:hypothetical protein
MAKLAKAGALARKAGKRAGTAGMDCVLFPLSMVDVPVGAKFQVQGQAASITNQVTATLQPPSSSNVNVTASNLLTQNATWISDSITLGMASTTYTFTATFAHTDGTHKDVPVTYKTAANRALRRRKDEIKFPPSSLILPRSTFNVVGFAAPATTRIEAFVVFRDPYFKMRRCKRIAVTLNNTGRNNASWQTAEITFRWPKTIYSILVIFHHGAGKLAGAAARVYQTVAAPRRGRRRKLRRKG